MSNHGSRVAIGAGQEGVSWRKSQRGKIPRKRELDRAKEMLQIVAEFEPLALIRKTKSERGDGRKSRV